MGVIVAYTEIRIKEKNKISFIRSIIWLALDFSRRVLGDDDSEVDESNEKENTQILQIQGQYKGKKWSRSEIFLHFKALFFILPSCT